jgi:hypothetical protein
MPCPLTSPPRPAPLIPTREEFFTADRRQRFAAFVAGYGLVLAECIRPMTWLPDITLEFLHFAVPTMIGGTIAVLPVTAIIAFLVDRQPDQIVSPPLAVQ